MGNAGLGTSDAVAMLQAVARAVIDRVDLLTDADLAIGDGDHGIGMRRGFEAVLAALDAGSPDIDAAFRATGMAIMANTGGAAGAVFGTLFTSGAKAFAGADRIDADGIRRFLAAAQEGVAKRGGVTEGQKTMLDALAHAARACGDAASLTACLTAAAQGAEAGVEATKSMVATTGKARSLGRTQLGPPRPGRNFRGHHPDRHARFRGGPDNRSRRIAMADLDDIKDGKDWGRDRPADTSRFFLKGAANHDWGMKARLAQIFRPDTGRTVMLAFDHGYFQGPTTGLERIDLTIAPLAPHTDVLMCTRGGLRACIEPEVRKPVVLRCSAGNSILTELSNELVGVEIDDAIRLGVVGDGCADLHRCGIRTQIHL